MLSWLNSILQSFSPAWRLADAGKAMLQADAKPQATLEHVMQALEEEKRKRRLSEQRLLLTAKVIRNIQEGIVITDAQGNIVEVNDAFTRISGYSADDLIGQNPRILKSGQQSREFYAGMWRTLKAEGRWSGEIWNSKKDGSIYAEWLEICAIADEARQTCYYLGICSDITQAKHHAKQLERIAHYDALTGLPNRLLLTDRLAHAIAQTKRDKKLLAVCHLDLDGFKPVNEALGHEAGDRLLLAISKRLSQGVQGGDTVARLGADEFVLLLLALDSEEQCADSLSRLLASIAQPVHVLDKQASLTASIGYTLYPLDEEDADALLRHANQAMYVAKQMGKNTAHLYDAAHDKRVRARQESLKRIQQGLQNGEFTLYYQPKVDMAAHSGIAAEALLRWQHPERGLLSPGDFLPIIEHSELEILVGEWVIRTALEQLEEWRKNGLDIEISINIAANHLQSEQFVDCLRRKLAEYPDLPPSRLQIEIVETAALEDVQNAIRVIEACQDLGVGFAIDDFGTGYSSLAYLRNLPIKTIKIDQTFVRDMLTDKGDMAIVQGIIALAKTFGHKTVAEGVETMGHFQALVDLGCESGQGYGIAHPMPPEQLPAWCRQRLAGELNT